MKWTFEYFDDLSAVWLLHELPGNAFACIEYHPSHPDFLDYTIALYETDSYLWNKKHAKTVEKAKIVGGKMIKQWKAKRRKDFK